MERFIGFVKILRAMRVDVVTEAHCIMWRNSLVLWNLYIH